MAASADCGQGSGAALYCTTAVQRAVEQVPEIQPEMQKAVIECSLLPPFAMQAHADREDSFYAQLRQLQMFWKVWHRPTAICLVGTKSAPRTACAPQHMHGV